MSFTEETRLTNIEEGEVNGSHHQGINGQLGEHSTQTLPHKLGIQDLIPK